MSRCVPGIVGVFCLTGCIQEMANQPRFEAYETSRFFTDQMAMRRPVEGTIARGELLDISAVTTGSLDGQAIQVLPLPLTRELLQRGRERFGIFCAHCHGLIGDGDGMVVRRGFPAPPTYHSDRLRSVADGQVFRIVSGGSARMPAFQNRISINDRWAIVAWVRTLQLSQYVKHEDLPPQDQQQLQQNQ